MPVGAESLTRGDAIIVDHAQRPEPHVGRVVVVGEGKAVAGVEPTVVGVPSLVAPSYADHDPASLSMNEARKLRNARIKNKLAYTEFTIS
jgi:hypothetical protein